MVRIDSHQHFWNFDPVRDSWITAEMDVIRRDFSPADLEPLLNRHEFDGSVVVQSDQSETDNELLLSYANESHFIKGVVGWVDLQAVNLEQRLGYYSSQKKMKGFRHVLQGESERGFMLKPSFMNGISRLSKYGFTYDILIHADQLKFIPGFVEKFPNQKFVIDHIAKPDIKSQQLGEWKTAIEKVARYENVSCKISGMVTEANWNKWKQEDFVPFIDVVIESFGPNRIMYGSDWPVCLVAASYEKMLGIVQEYFSSFSPSEQELFFGGNAVQFYNLFNDEEN